MTGESRASLHFSFRIGKSTVSNILKETCIALGVCLKTFIEIPNTVEKWADVASDFYCRWNMPLCLGSIDGKHISIRQPEHSGSHNINYKGFFSVVLLAVVDANLNFMYIDVGTNGRISDGGVFAKSEFKRMLIDNNYFNMPDSALLPFTNVRLPFVFIADDAFPLSTKLMKPYPQQTLDNTKRIFNYRLSRARRCVENAFGVLAARFGVFQKAINTSIENVQHITVAACSLHNMLRKRNGDSYIPPRFIDSEDLTLNSLNEGEWRDHVNAMRGLRNETVRACDAALNNRTTMAHYFVGPGKVSWQDAMANII